MFMGDDMLIMKNGQMLILRDSEMIALSEDMILGQRDVCFVINGIRVAFRA